jgi:hypothetical protein
MFDTKEVGKFHEKRGDDILRVIVSGDGDVVGIEQYDAIGHRWNLVNLFAESVPALVKLLQKAAGITVPATVWEYGVEQVHVKTGEIALAGGYRTWFKQKSSAVDVYESYVDEKYIDSYGDPVYTYRVVRREKPKDYEYVN